MTFAVYILFNTINGKMYVGKGADPAGRLKDHIRIARGGKKTYKRQHRLIHDAITKYGIDNFILSTLQVFGKEEDSFAAEKYWIAFYKTNVFRFGNEFGYNLTDGGEGQCGRSPSPEQIEKIAKAGREWIRSEEEKQRLRTLCVGRKLSAETKAKIGLGQKNRVYKTGFHLSDETKEKISVAQRGELNHNFGKITSDDERKEQCINSHFAILNIQLVKEIRELHKFGVSQKEIAIKYNVKQNTISNIVNYKTWKFI